MLIASQAPLDKWRHVIGDPTLGDAILDRLTHYAYKFALKGIAIRKRLKINTDNRLNSGLPQDDTQEMRQRFAAILAAYVAYYNGPSPKVTDQSRHDLRWMNSRETQVSLYGLPASANATTAGMSWKRIAVPGMAGLLHISTDYGATIHALATITVTLLSRLRRVRRLN